jgi:hypothetical protein
MAICNVNVVGQRNILTNIKNILTNILFMQSYEYDVRKIFIIISGGCLYEDSKNNI